ncbi:hypothetical protein SAMN02745751_00680 [Dethiosulfatibacter aminovorans DSM 17477]|uniref:Uncharacterized protein n=1 Tax=Dethiosulfatibacter aminovorans DSM 17477 TaxID=1121476 RepID=A0A1M6CF91_9FIRM|nr:hypothetical protein [Dethiosulfatibacter aminovorans]SHI59434.1 hypothetical protein SAMN02745751_00680 [Dethiosulfatibacter aminovorans DSM 17477]
MLSYVVLGIFVFLIISFMFVLFVELISSAADGEKRRKKLLEKQKERKIIAKRVQKYTDNYFDKYSRRL